ncbi:MAG: response regulator [Chloroflexota bacterium]|nr:response regulator [Anaerolineales bacterium]MCA9976292.1 response regulator [Anaerolineales bacterium]MCB8968630.1 response regulator [Ardenticatenaceae bacterium]
MTQIIVVDDDLTNVSLTKMLLEMDGFDVIACTNLAQAEAASNLETKAYVVDVNLARNESGMDLLQMVRNGETAASSNTVVVITSGDYRREQEALDKGANRFLLKPYPPDQLPEILRTLIEGNKHD